MDQQRFDQLTKTLATGKSRRGLLKGLTGITLGGALAAIGLGETVAHPQVPCKAPNVKCGKGKNAVCCSSGICTPNGTCGCVGPGAPGSDCTLSTQCCSGICGDDGRGGVACY